MKVILKQLKDERYDFVSLAMSIALGNITSLVKGHKHLTGIKLHVHLMNHDTITQDRM